ncbi:hypothetical protein FOPG_20091 [Fusarium oxysporum f. sp. conglutinans race 2 54008]|uniref:Uncharacterized protein n=1 Tax=Fusarium oxysporum f. sp. conglutinans race 2 54008 TaxID=1089457 RepID=X0GUN1_FUSOX|nr:hypothetical protein FOPG_20091 [Fusarium oxysporum f. sp. conglutinans race 2 54008]
MRSVSRPGLSCLLQYPRSVSMRTASVASSTARPRRFGSLATPSS